MPLLGTMSRALFVVAAAQFAACSTDDPSPPPTSVTRAAHDSTAYPADSFAIGCDTAWADTIHQTY
ncbi:MAG: hypothetical protein J6Z14_04950 [Prevotella sp.]|nr:hypothetical protein [Prevotella sp.]